MTNQMKEALRNKFSSLFSFGMAVWFFYLAYECFTKGHPILGALAVCMAIRYTIESEK